MQYYFASFINQENIVLEDSDIYHLSTVMRAKNGTQIKAIYEKEVYLGEVVNLKPLIIKNLGKTDEKSRELDKKVTLFFALVKGDKIDFVIQKATELGVSKIVLIKTEHCVVKMDNDDLERKINNRYARIAKEASEQCERRIIPEIKGVYDIRNIPSSELASLNLVAYEKEAYQPIDFKEVKNHDSISVLIGPEGGLSKDEVEVLEKQDFHLVSLGKRILRTETAAISALSMINMVIEQ